MPNTNQKTFQNALMGLHDARSTQGIFARGRNVNGTGKNARTGYAPAANLNKSYANRAFEIRQAPVGAAGGPPMAPNWARENRARKAMYGGPGVAQESPYTGAIQRRLKKGV